MRKKVILGNWKLNNDLTESLEFLSKLRIFINEEKNMKTLNENKVIFGLAPQAPLLHTMLDHGPQELWTIAQNVSTNTAGAFTGEVSPNVLLSLGVSNVLIGHSERRELFNETNEIVKKKVDLALEKCMNIILCCGEDLKVREANDHKAFVVDQLENALKNVPVNKLNYIYIAYEPIWAIGTGKTATSQDAEDMCKEIRNLIHRLYTEEASKRIHILYGGSVKPANINELCKMDNIDGALVGGASVKAESFIQLLENC